MKLLDLKTQNSNTPFLIKTKAGIEILGTLLYSDENTFTAAKLRELHVVPNAPQPGTPGQQVSMSISIAKPFVTLDPDAELEFLYTDIYAAFEVPLDIEKHYLEQTSGIQLA